MSLPRTKYCFLFSILILTIASSKAQKRNISFFAPDSAFNVNRVAVVGFTEVTLYSTSLIGLNELWYKDYPRSNFHLFNDADEWLQMDKAGHMLTSYAVGLVGIDLLKWSGVKSPKALWYGGLLGFVYLGSIEVLDGFSNGWGFSVSDITANTLGCALVMAQQAAFNEQRVTLKFWTQPSKYAQYRSNLLGRDFSEQWLKDYNGQTYWASINVASFLNKETAFPKWLNVAIGYGADGMTGGKSNPEYIDKSGNKIVFERYRQYYLSLDIDLRRIKTKSHFANTLFKTIGFIKFPLPSLEFNKHGVKGHWIGF